MLLKKIDRGEVFLKEHLDLFRCPKCQEKMARVADYHVSCQAGHQFDLSKKGTLHFIDHHVKTDYDKEMLLHRQKMIQEGLYNPLIEKLSTYLGNDVETIVDMGCGEGSFLNELMSFGIPGTKIGFDISKDGINLATEQEVAAFWCIADMTNLPFNDSSLSHLLNIFSPSQYSEFRRVLKPGGKLIKIVPEANYLKELRQAFYQDDQEKLTYSNEKVVTKFSEEMTLVSQERLTYDFTVESKFQKDLLKMSPLHWGASAEALAKAEEELIEKITIDLLILVGEL